MLRTQQRRYQPFYKLDVHLHDDELFVHPLQLGLATTQSGNQRIPSLSLIARRFLTVLLGEPILSRVH